MNDPEPHGLDATASATLDRVLRPPLDRLADRLRSRLPDGLDCAVGTSANDFFPFRGYVAISTAVAESDELAVLSVDVTRRGESLRVAADVAAGDGRVESEAETKLGLARWSPEDLDSIIRFIDNADESLARLT